MKLRGNPVTGRSPTAMPTFIRIWKKNINEMPADKREANRSRDSKLTSIPLSGILKSRRRISVPPRKPVRSHQAVKMKSVYA